MITGELIRNKLAEVIDPELGVDIVSLGFIYKINLTPSGKVHILMTLSSPGCPLAGVFGTMIKDTLKDIPGLNVDQDISIELTFDPPWTIEMMSEETRAKLGL